MGLAGLVSVAFKASAGMMGRAAPLKLNPSDGEVAPRAMGCAWIVPRQGAICLASNDGSISPPVVAPISFRTSGSFGWTGVLVIVCQKQARSRTSCGRDAHGAAAVYGCPRIDSGV